MRLDDPARPLDHRGVPQYCKPDGGAIAPWVGLNVRMVLMGEEKPYQLEVSAFLCKRFAVATYFEIEIAAAELLPLFDQLAGDLEGTLGRRFGWEWRPERTPTLEEMEERIARKHKSEGKVTTSLAELGLG